MKVQILSDLHTEFLPQREYPVARFLEQIVPVAPILLLAGDVGNVSAFSYMYRELFRDVSKKFEHIFFVLGNHDYYQLKDSVRNTMEEVEDHITGLLENLPNVHFLNRGTFDLDDEWRIIGCTFWSNTDDVRLINDATYIPNMTTESYNQLHNRDRAFIDQEISRAQHEGKRVIVVTHHLPSFQLISNKFRKLGPANRCYASNCEDLLRSPVELWAFGHSHSPTNQQINGIACMSNPIGYPHEMPTPNFSCCWEFRICVYCHRDDRSDGFIFWTKPPDSQHWLCETCYCTQK